MDSKKLGLIAAAVVVLVLAYGGYRMMSQSETGEETETAIQTSSPAATTSDTMMASGSGTTTTDGVKEFIVDGTNFRFEPSTLNVNQGDKVRVVFKNISGTHDFVIDALNIKTETTQTGDTETVEFTADKIGTFEYYCSISNHRAMGMKGALVVN